MRVDVLQSVDTSAFPPSPAWMSGRENTGEGIWIGIYDEPIDTTHPDFRETGEDGVSRFRGAPIWDPFYGRAGCCPHGTHVASIAAGNGAASETSGGVRYQWRGIAFKSRFVAGVGNGLTGEGDVNNHSVANDAGAYNDLDQALDSMLFDHAAYGHAVVYGAGDNGDRPNYGSTQGYYSILNQAKNPITVGATYQEVPFVAAFSSLGPTLDGRIKPDVVAPGTSYFFPERSPNPLRISLDSIVLRNGRVKAGWRFARDPEGWEPHYQAENFAAVGGILRFDSPWIGTWIRNTAFSPFTAETGDTLILGYKLSHPQIPSRVDHLQCALTWNRPPQPDSLFFNLPIPDTNWREARIPLSNLWGYSEDRMSKVKRWRAGELVDSLWLGFHCDSLTGIYAAASGNALGAYRYEEGTSMAAPQVSGVVALMLQAYARRGYLKPGEDIHRHAPWNSTLKALLVHTATDLVKAAPLSVEVPVGPDARGNPDLAANEPLGMTYTRYYRGPDFASGYGLVNASKAVDFMDTNHFRQGTLTQGKISTYQFSVPTGRGSLRATLAWDDAAGDEHHPDSPQLVNDLDLILVSPNGKIHHPWVLNPLPRSPSGGLDPMRASDIDSAHRGVNFRDNVEVVDVPGPVTPGTWLLRVNGSRVKREPQDFSVVCDFPLRLKSR